MKILSTLAGGVAGAVVLTLLHETTRRLVDDAPRMDLLGMEALEKGLKKMDAPVPDQQKLFNLTMAGDLLSNSLYYSMVGLTPAKYRLAAGGMLGLAAGLGAVCLPKHMGLNPEHSNRTQQTKIMTTVLYLTGGLVAGAVGCMAGDEDEGISNCEHGERV